MTNTSWLPHAVAKSKAAEELLCENRPFRIGYAVGQRQYRRGRRVETLETPQAMTRIPREGRDRRPQRAVHGKRFLHVALAHIEVLGEKSSARRCDCRTR